MKRFFSALFLAAAMLPALAQIKIPTCPLDSLDFDKAYQYRQWNLDTVMAKDLEHRVNYLAALHRNYLPQHRMLKKSLAAQIDAQSAKNLAELDSTYLKELARFNIVYLGGLPGFNQNLPIFIRLNFIVIIETFRTYPDIYGVLLNNCHPHSMQDTSVEEDGKAVENHVNFVYDRTKKRLLPAFEEPFKAFLAGMKLLQETEKAWLPWYGALPPEAREKYDWVSFLLWCQ